jgi:hypothetical protein
MKEVVAYVTACHGYSERRACALTRQLASGYNKRPKVEAAMSRYKRVIGGALRSMEDTRRLCEVKIAVKALNRMLELGRPACVRAA